MQARSMAVSTAPGQTALTLMPSGAKLEAMHWVMLLTAALEAQ